MNKLICSLSIFAALFISALFFATTVSATEEIAGETGYECSYCHLDPSGGGELTVKGDLFLEQAEKSGTVTSLGTFDKLFRLLTGYLHILFAVLWFGTILYVHIVLKPAYAAQGLPSGEKFVGILSFWVVGITGVVLTLYRVDSWSQLIETRFGILLVVKVSLYLLMLISAIFVIKVVGPRLKKQKRTEYKPGDPFNAETLLNFDGKEGRPCYFAYAGKVYDAENSKMWSGGHHMQRHNAGTDLTEVLSLAPHDDDVMERLPVVGDFVEGPNEAGHDARVFFFIAYMNLIIVFLILFVLALWRWW
jgi:predicted heme/steroid binding protein/uncharacterized membrane protein